VSEQNETLSEKSSKSSSRTGYDCAISLLRKQLKDKNDGSNYLTKVSNSFNPSNPNSIMNNGGTSNSFLLIDDPTIDIEIKSP
jgi:hypothetical protein